MANWRQIQGRIRRARTSADPAGKLNELFQKTRDAMVAFEAGTLEEKSGRSEEAARWYTIAAQRFRREDWRKKAEEALTRLGAPVPDANPQISSGPREDRTEEGGELGYRGAAADTGDSQSELEENGEMQPAESEVDAQVRVSANAPQQAAQQPRRGGRRRGRRGGRRHRRSGARDARAISQPQTQGHNAVHLRPASQIQSATEAGEEDETAAAQPARTETTDAAARFVPEPSGQFVERVTYIRAGDPALASRFAQLESLLRRLISAPLHRMDELGEAPASPGVFLLSDSDLMTTYYVEACQTLRIGASQLAKAGKAGRGARAESKGALRSQLAEHLEISETQVNDYLKKHCVVRWLQLDEDAPRLAHFAIAVLRPVLNTD